MAHEQSEVSTDRYYFLIRRLHSLSGLIPLGVFLFLHLATNVSILAPGSPGEQFQHQVEKIHALGPLLKPVEVFGILLPLLFHTLIGFQIIFTSQPNSQAYRYGSNIRYTLQRTTGVIATLFILGHLWQMHWVGKPMGGGMFALHGEGGGPAAAVSTAGAIQAAWWVAPLYAVGILATVFHLANGVWTSLITWGITIRPQSQRVAGYLCTVFGVILAVMGLGALAGFRRFDLGPTRLAPDQYPSAAMVSTPPELDRNEGAAP